MTQSRPCHPMHPLQGLSPARISALDHQYVVSPGQSGRGVSLPYRALAPTGAVRVAPLFSIQHSTFSIVNWSYTFSAKERDSETGLSYFGSRYYSSDLSIWLSVDPMASKYPSMSPYVYCANNPVRLVDPDGEEIVISMSMDENGNRIVNISFTATLVNKSSKDVSLEDMEKYKNDITNGIKKTFAGQKDDGTIVKVDVDINVQNKGESMDPLSSRHTINIVDKFEDQTHSAESIIGGGYMDIRLDVCRGDYPETPVGRSAAHEFGHLLGLDHVESADNIMNPKTRGRVITGSQIKDACAIYCNEGLNRNIFALERRRERRLQLLNTHK